MRIIPYSDYMKYNYTNSLRKNIDNNNIPSQVEDDPERRIRETTLDRVEEETPFSKLRLEALNAAKKMPIDEEGTLQSPIEDYKYSQPSDRGKSNWLQIGPTSIPDGQSFSSYNSNDNISTNVTGRITSIVVDPVDSNIIYVGTALGGIWKTTDGGRNWIAKSDYAPSLGIGALVIDPIDHNILYAGTGEGNISLEVSQPSSYYGCGILKSEDSGEIWKLIGDNIFNGASFYRIAIDPDNSSIIFAATTYGLFRSDDKGQKWEQMKNGIPFENNNKNNNKVTDVVIHPKNTNIVYAAVEGKGIYKTENARDNNSIWQPLNIPTFNLNSTRIALAISNSSPYYLYALIPSYNIINQFYVFDEYGNNCKAIKLPTINGNIGGQGDYNLNIAVDPTSSEIVYLSGISLWKATKDSKDPNNWSIKDIGLSIHPDQHAFTFDPKNSSIIYAGSDGGIYKSINGGDSWIDEINEGLCITQFEAMDQHPTSNAFIICGTQDNGTVTYRNSPAFYFSDYGDGGFVSIDPNNPTNIIHQYIRNTILHSKLGGKLGSWIDVTVPTGSYLFYAPFTLDNENPKNIAFGSDKIFLDTNQGLNGWKTTDGKKNSIKLNEKPDDELISAISYVNSKLIYSGTNDGKVFRCEKIQDGWNTIRIDKNLPERYIWDIQSMPNDLNTIIIAMAGFGSDTKTPGIHRGTFKSEGNLFEWENISGDDGIGKLPFTPISSIVIDNDYPHTIYIGTDIGVFRKSKNGNSWIRFSQGLPVCSIYDMRLLKVNNQKFLRVATHGRGMWERELDIESYKDVNLYLRNNLMDTAQLNISVNLTFAAFADYLQGENEDIININDIMSWDMCPDIKIDSPKGQLSLYQYEIMDDVDYVKFEHRLQNRNPKRGRWCNIYVQIHDRGIQPIVKDVIVKLCYANLNGTYPDLPPDFWTSFPNNTFDTTYWKPIGEYKTIPNGSKILTNTEPTILTWQWYVPEDIHNNVGILVVIESPDDPIDNNNKIVNIEELVKRDRHIGLRNINVVN
jgi:hypothetical protein